MNKGVPLGVIDLRSAVGHRESREFVLVARRIRVLIEKFDTKINMRDVWFGKHRSHTNRETQIIYVSQMISVHDEEYLIQVARIKHNDEMDFI